MGIWPTSIIFSLMNQVVYTSSPQVGIRAMKVAIASFHKVLAPVNGWS
jgi:hypothetical protein